MYLFRFYILSICFVFFFFSGWANSDEIIQLQKDGEYAKAIELIDRELKKRPEKHVEVNLYKMASETWFRLREFEKSDSLIDLAIELGKQLNNDTLMARLYNNKGIVFTLTRNWDSCLYYYDLSLRLKQKINDHVGVLSSCSNIGIVYKKKGQYEKAVSMYNKSLKIALKHSEIEKQYKIINNIANIYRKLNNDSAKYYYRKALKLAEQEGDVIEERRIYSNLKNLAIEENDYKNVIDYSDRYIRLSDQIFSLDKEKQLADFELKQEIDRKNHIIELQNLKISNKQRFIVFISIASVLLLIALIFVFYYYKQVRKAKDELILSKEESLKNYLIGQENERKRIAKQLHDDLNCSLAGVRLTDRKDFYASQAQGMLDNAVEEIFSEALDKAGLKMALFQYEDLLMNDGVEINFSSNKRLPRFERWQEVSVYRLAQGFVKAGRLKGATLMHLGLYFEEETSEIELSLITEKHELEESCFDEQTKALMAILNTKLEIKGEVSSIITKLKIQEKDGVLNC